MRHPADIGGRGAGASQGGDLGEVLAAFVRDRGQARQASVVSLELLSGGAIQQNWRLRLQLEGGPHAGAQDYVVRTDAPSSVAASRTRAQEHALLRVAFDARVTVPQPLWLCEDRAVIGRPFFVMRWVEGTAAGHLLVKDARLGGPRPQLAERLGRELARIHAIRPPQADLAFLGEPGVAPALEGVARLRAHLDRLATPRPALEWGLHWLEQHAPAPREVVLCHRDFRTGNYMVDAEGLTAILDWEFADWSDPLEDIGWFCARCWRFGAQAAEAGGIGARADFYRGYESAAGRRIDTAAVRWWEVMAHARWAVIALQQAERHVRGEERSLLLALTGHIVPELEHEILMQTEAA